MSTYPTAVLFNCSIANPVIPATVETTKPSQPRRRPHSKRQKPAVSIAVREKRPSLQHDAASYLTQHELLFAQLTEQLRAAGLPNAATASSMSIRSRCSSAPASEFGGDDDDEPLRTRASSNAAEDEEEMIDWDEPDLPDDGNDSTARSFSFTACHHSLCTRLSLLRQRFIPLVSSH